ncbi:Brix domain-containing protein [Syncephalis fuscata]|nr:Brix domain-containing protein [Syncephalis fuscata]
MARRRKTRTHNKGKEGAVPEGANVENATKIPKSFVIRAGNPGRSVSELVHDIRSVMEPHTASRLKERKNNKLKDFIQVAGQLGVTHMLVFGRTETAVNLRMARVPHGPTLTFRICTYSLARDVLSSQRRPKSPGAEFQTAPLLVMNNFGGEQKQMKLLTAMFQNLFAPINVKTMKLSEARRVVLLNYNTDTGNIDFRHYSINVKPVGVTKGVKRVIINTNLPNLSQFEDVSDYVLREAFASESDVEDGPENTVTLSQRYVGRNNQSSEQRAVRLTEMGPRMELKLLKVEAGLCNGEVLYHHHGKWLYILYVYIDIMLMYGYSGKDKG